MHRLKQTVAILILVTLLLSWGLVTALIQGAEVEQVGERVSAIGANCYYFLAARKTKPVIKVETGPGVPPDRTICLEKMTRDIKNGHTASAGYPCIDIHVDQYLAWTGEGYTKLVAWGRALTMGYPPPGMLMPTDPALIEACYIAYAGAKWDAWIAFRGCTSSPFYGRGKEIARYLRSRGRGIELCLSCLEAESTYGLGGSCYFGILYGNYPNTVKGYCDLLDDHGVADDPYSFSRFWNSPGGSRYADGINRLYTTIKNWWP